jgi:hypothetical protein
LTGTSLLCIPRDPVLSFIDVSSEPGRKRSE